VYDNPYPPLAVEFPQDLAMRLSIADPPPSSPPLPRTYFIIDYTLKRYNPLFFIFTSI